MHVTQLTALKMAMMQKPLQQCAAVCTPHTNALYMCVGVLRGFKSFMKDTEEEAKLMSTLFKGRERQ
jgi:hypothetical protein